MTKDQIFEFFRRLAEDNPEPETELAHTIGEHFGFDAERTDALLSQVLETE